MRYKKRRRDGRWRGRETKEGDQANPGKTKPKTELEATGRANKIPPTTRTRDNRGLSQQLLFSIARSSE